MRSSTTRRFRAAYAALPKDAQRKARLAYRLFRENPSHPSLQFKKVDDPNIYSVRLGLGYRALGALDGSDLWIGQHSAYDRLIWFRVGGEVTPRRLDGLKLSR